MKYRGVEIADLSSSDLTEAQMLMWASEDFFKKRVANPKYAERFKNQPLPPINPNFYMLKTTLETEMKNRNLPLTGEESKVN